MKGGTWLSINESIEKNFHSIDTNGLFIFDYMLIATQLYLDWILQASQLPVLFLQDKFFLII